MQANSDNSDYQVDYLIIALVFVFGLGRNAKDADESQKTVGGEGRHHENHQTTLTNKTTIDQA
jgi:hypothetical protein